jgi:hypothetical protein
VQKPTFQMGYLKNKKHEISIQSFSSNKIMNILTIHSYLGWVATPFSPLWNFFSVPFFLSENTLQIVDGTHLKVETKSTLNKNT